MKPTKGLTGKLLTSKDLDAYEVMWHTKVFTPSWNSLYDEVMKLMDV